MLMDHPLDLEIIWLVQYSPECRRRALPRLIERFGREAVANEFAKRVEGAGANVISITRARNWERPSGKRRPRGPSWAA
jgi:hypothetical protein